MLWFISSFAFGLCSSLPLLLGSIWGFSMWSGFSKLLDLQNRDLEYTTPNKTIIKFYILSEIITNLKKEVSQLIRGPRKI
jgi:hypothetical protein